MKERVDAASSVRVAVAWSYVSNSSSRGLNSSYKGDVFSHTVCRGSAGYLSTILHFAFSLSKLLDSLNTILIRAVPVPCKRLTSTASTTRTGLICASMSFLVVCFLSSGTDFFSVSKGFLEVGKTGNHSPSNQIRGWPDVRHAPKLSFDVLKKHNGPDV